MFKLHSELSFDTKHPISQNPNVCRSFEKRDRLRIHILHVHENHRPHVCNVCGKAFSQSSSLNKVGFKSFFIVVFSFINE
jgi:uncharacterized Zn-finger protein